MQFRHSVAMGLILLLAVIGSFYITVLRADGKDSAIDHTRWMVTVEPGEMAHTLTFADGFVTINHARNLGFNSSAYQVNENGEQAWTFTTQQQDVAQGEQLCAGTIKGNDIRGEMVLTELDGTVLTYPFEGTRID